MPVDVELPEPPEVPEPSGRPTMREVIRHSLAGPTGSLVQHLASVPLHEDDEDDEDVEDVHQARVAIRRIRSRLRTFGPLVDRRWADELSTGLRDMGRALGEVRDLDVLTGIVVSTPWDGPGTVELLATVEAERDDARARLVRVVEDPGCRALVARLVDVVADPVLAPQADDPAGPVAALLVRRPWRRLRRAVRRLPSEPPAAALHRVRILTKRCRYAVEAVRPVVGPDADRLARRLGDLQDELGHLNDAVVVAAHLQSLGPVLTHRGTFAAGVVSGVLVERADRHAAAWRRPWRKAERAAGWIP